MSENRLVLNTKKSLYEPIEIEIDGQVYQSIKTTRAVLTEINKLAANITKDNAGPLYKIVHILFKIDPKILEKLDKREVQDIWTFSQKNFFEIERQRLELIQNTIDKISRSTKQKTKETIPNRKRSGNRR